MVTSEQKLSKEKNIFRPHFFFLALFFAVSSWAAVADLELKDLEGNFHKLSDYRGRIVVLNFWATWCVPCRKEMPLFVELQNEYGSRGVQIIAASTDAPDSQQEIPKFVKEFHLNFPVWIGATPEQQASFRLGTGLPGTVIIDVDGNPAYRIIGESTREMLEQRMECLLSKGALPSPPDLVLPPGITPEHWKEHETGMEEDHEHTDEMVQEGSHVPS